MSFELWDTESGNLIAVYPSKGSALLFVKAVIEEDGEDTIDQWELFEMSDDESAESLAFGEQLAAIARAQRPTAA